MDPSEGGETRRDVSFGEMAGQDGRNKMRIVFLPSVLNGDCQPWSFLTPPPSPRVQSRQPKKITPGELSSSSLSLSRVVGMTLFLFFFLFYPSREAPLGGRGWGDGDEREILRVEAQRTLFISHSPALLSLSRWCQLVRVLLDLQVSTPLGWRGGGGGGGRAVAVAAARNDM